MSFTGQNDPFLEAQADVLSTLKTTRSLFASYIRIRSSASSPSSPELTEARNELENTVQDLSTDLQDLVDSVKAVEGDPFRYGLDIDEVGRRRKLVQDAGDEVENMRQELARTVVGAQSQSKGMNGSLPPPSAFEADADEYGAYEQEQQVQMMQEQDEALDGVFKTVGNLRQQADDMGRELEEQDEMLGDVDRLADRVQGKLANGMKRVGYLVELLHWCLDIRLDSSACTRTHTLNSSGSRQDTFEDNVESRGVAFGWKGHTSRLARGDLWYHHEDIIYGKIRTDAAKGSVPLSRRMHLRPPVAVGADPALTKVISNPETFGPIPVNYHKVNGAGEANPDPNNAYPSTQHSSQSPSGNPSSKPTSRSPQGSSCSQAERG